jgi:hypothetical protein
LSMRGVCGAQQADCQGGGGNPFGQRKHL